MAKGFYGRSGLQITNTLTSGLDKLSDKVKGAAEAAVAAGAEIVQQRAIELCPVSAGKGHGADGSHMVEHIEVMMQNDSGTFVSAKIGVFNTSIIPYAPHVEFGANGRPFLRPAIDETRQEVHDVMLSTFFQAIASGSISARSAVRFRRFA